MTGTWHAKKGGGSWLSPFTSETSTQTQVLWFGSKLLYTGSHLTPVFTFLNILTENIICASDFCPEWLGWLYFIPVFLFTANFQEALWAPTATTCSRARLSESQTL